MRRCGCVCAGIGLVHHAHRDLQVDRGRTGRCCSGMKCSVWRGKALLTSLVHVVVAGKCDKAVLGDVSA
jgi:hypothetical protein